MRLRPAHVYQAGPITAGFAEADARTIQIS